MTLALDNPAKPHLKQWTMRAYHKASDLGGFRGEHILLFGWELIEMPPMGSLHIFGIANVNDWLMHLFSPVPRNRIHCPRWRWSRTF